MSDQPVNPSVEAAIAAIEHAYARVVAMIEVDDPSIEGYNAATQLVERLDKLVSGAASLRGAELRRVRVARQLTMTELSDETGLKRERAYALIKKSEGVIR